MQTIEIRNIGPLVETGNCSSFSSYVVDRRAEHWKEYFHEDSVFLLLARKAGDDRWGGDRF